MKLLHELLGKEYNITQQFGVANGEYLSGIHNGTDIALPVGTPIMAPTAGVAGNVWKNNPSIGNALLFVFADGGRVYTLRMMHFSEVMARANTFVKKGEVLALSGDTGKSTGPHVHVELWTRPYMPSVLLRKHTVLETLINPELFELTDMEHGN